MHCFVWLLGIVWLFAGASQVHAQQAGLMVVHGNGDLVTRCVSLPAPEVSGLTLVLESGLDLGSDVTAMGASVCRLDGEGCKADQSCFCNCTSSPCMYWSYWRQVEHVWNYSMVGAESTIVRHGDVEAWVWTQGIVGREADSQPPAMTFEDICVVHEQTTATSSVVDGAVAAAERADGAAPADTSGAWSDLLTSYAGLLLVVGIPMVVLAVGGLIWLWRRDIEDSA